MTRPDGLNLLSDQLIKKYGQPGLRAADQISTWLSGKVPFSNPLTIAQLVRDGSVSLLFDSFWRLLPFGTGGRRGPVGYGPNRMNPTIVAMTVQGHCEYLKTTSSPEKLSVVVANDVRIFRDISNSYRMLPSGHPLIGTSSRSLAVLACEIYAGNGISAYLAEPGSPTAVMTTPMLSFAIRQLGATGGVNLSASHNPPDDNGIKVYDGCGGQPIPPEDQHLADLMEGSTSISPLPFDEAVRCGLVGPVPNEIAENYAKTYTRIYADAHVADQHLPITYTPLCGAGLTSVGTVLRRLSFPVVVPPDQEADGLFASIPFRAPNPEVPEATQPAKVFAEANGSTIVLSSDPDADRVGLDVRKSDGSWYHFNGNQIAAILAYYLMLDPRGPRRSGLLIETLVTTRLLREIAHRAGSRCVVDDLLVGFKYVADVLQALTETGRYRDIQCRPNDLCIAAEESHGILLTHLVRDKDATGPSMYLAALHQRLQQRGRTLLDYYARILEDLGPYDCVNRSIMLRGAEGIEKRDRIMEALRSTPPAELAGAKVLQAVDYWNVSRFGPIKSETDRASRNLLAFSAEGFRVVVRPSGTEPKIKLYCEVLPVDHTPPARGAMLLAEARAQADRIARSVYGELLSRVGASLGDAALLLPDLVDLECKIDFEQNTLPRLCAALQSNAFPDLEAILSWLRLEVASMTPGTDPLPAIRGGISVACRNWKTQTSSPLLQALSDWATGAEQAPMGEQTGSGRGDDYGPQGSGPL